LEGSLKRAYQYVANASTSTFFGSAGPGVFPAADAEAAAGDAESAFDRLLALMAAVPDRKPEIRDRLLELFALFDPTDPRVLAARGKLASALF